MFCSAGAEEMHAQTACLLGAGTFGKQPATVMGLKSNGKETNPGASAMAPMGPFPDARGSQPIIKQT